MIKIDKVSRVYDGETPVRALDEVNFTLPEKGMVFVVGKSGSGKSTLLNVLAGFDKPTSGRIYFNNKKISDFTNRELDYYRNSTIGFVFQDYCLIETFNAYQNIKMSFDYKNEKTNRQELDKILDSVGMKGYGKRLPKQLSAGQKQRVAIARCLAKNPKVILADEPTGNLDSKTTVQILDLLKEISKDRLIVVVSHNKNDAYKYGDRIIEMSNGQIKSYKYRNENFFNEYVSLENEITLPAKGRLSEDQLQEVNDKIKSSKGKVKLKRGLDEFLDINSQDESDKDYKNEPTKMGFFNLLKYSWLFFKNHILSFMLVVMIVICLIVTLSISVQFSNYNGELQYQEIIEENNMDSIVLRQLTADEIATGEIKEFNAELKEETISKILDKYDDLKYYNMYAYNIPINGNFASERITMKAVSKGVVKACNSLIECDIELLRNIFNVEQNIEIPLKAGQIKEDGNGIIITDYLADCLMVRYFINGLKTYEDLIKEETYLIKNYAVKIDAIIDTGYAVKYKDIIEEIKGGSTIEVTDEYSEIMELILSSYSYVYTLNSNYYTNYYNALKEIVPNTQSSSYYYIYNADYETETMNLESPTYKMYFREELKGNEIWMSYADYNALFNTNCSAKDMSEFVPKTIKIKLYDSDNSIFYEQEFEIVDLQTNTYYSYEVREKVMPKVFRKTGIYVTNHDNLGELVSYAIDSDLLVDNSRMSVVQKAIAVVAVFEELFTLLLVLMIIAIIVLVVIHTINTYNKNIYNIGVSKSMGAHMFELSYIFSIQMIVFGLLIVVGSMIADYYSTNIINDIIANAIPRIVNIPGSNTITYLKYNPAITSITSGAIMLLTMGSISVPLMAIRLMNPVNIIKSRQ